MLGGENINSCKHIEQNIEITAKITSTITFRNMLLGCNDRDRL